MLAASSAPVEFGEAATPMAAPVEFGEAATPMAPASSVGIEETATPIAATPIVLASSVGHEETTLSSSAASPVGFGEATAPIAPASSVGVEEAAPAQSSITASPVEFGEAATITVALASAWNRLQQCSRHQQLCIRFVAPGFHTWFHSSPAKCCHTPWTSLSCEETVP